MVTGTFLAVAAILVLSAVEGRAGRVGVGGGAGVRPHDLLLACPSWHFLKQRPRNLAPGLSCLALTLSE